jgi:ABC-type branched-subunit amino acid transport system ATPase component
MRLRARDLSSGYGKMPVIHDVNLGVEEGEFVVVLGPNGAGKTTLMRTLARLLPVLSGTVELEGRPINRWNEARATAGGVVFVPQEHNVFAELSVSENLEISAVSQGRKGRNNSKAIDEMLERFPVLEARRKQSAGTLSGGERQMLALAGALLMDPKIMLLDEPTTGLAPLIAEQFLQRVQGLCADGTSVIWVVEQHPQAVLRAADRAYLMTGGQIRYEGDTAGPESGDLMQLIWS